MIGSTFEVSTVVILNDFSFTDYNIDLQCIVLYPRCGTHGIAPQMTPCYKECHQASDSFNIQILNPFVGIYYPYNGSTYPYFEVTDSSITDCYYRVLDVNSVKVCVVSAETTDGDAVYVFTSSGGLCHTISSSTELFSYEYSVEFSLIDSATIVIVNVIIAAFESVTTYVTVTLLPCKGGLFTEEYNSDGEEGHALCPSRGITGILTCNNHYYRLQTGNCIEVTGVYDCPLRYGVNLRLEFDMEELLLNSTNFCADNREGRLCGRCADGHGVPINVLNKSVLNVLTIH